MEAGKEEQRNVVRFLTAEGVGYGEHSMSRSRVLAWHKRFREGRVSLQDNARPGQAQPTVKTREFSPTEEIQSCTHKFR
jgi:hypothetical protein